MGEEVVESCGSHLPDLPLTLVIWGYSGMFCSSKCDFGSMIGAGMDDFGRALIIVP